jgi:hypothetical protein
MQGFSYPATSAFTVSTIYPADGGGGGTGGGGVVAASASAAAVLLPLLPGLAFGLGWGLYGVPYGDGDVPGIVIGGAGTIF